jgi:hypothetical protein
MEMVDLTCSKREAFAAGFWRGLASPLTMYSTLALPASVVPKVQEVINPALRSGGVGGSWKRVGDHLRTAMEHESPKHG